MRRIFTKSNLVVIWSLAWGIMTPVADADTVVLSNGKTVDGVVVSEHQDRVVLDIGMGQMTFSRDRVARIERSSPSENQKRENVWKTKYIAVRELPEELRALSSQWDGLKASRTQALKAEEEFPGKVREFAQLEGSLHRVKTEYSALSRQIARRAMNQDVASYNQLVERNNALVAQTAGLERRLRANQAQRKKLNVRIAAYAKSLKRFETAFEPLHSVFGGGSKDEVATVWIGRVATSLESFRNDFSKISVPVSRGAGGPFIDVRINGKPPGSFILDTGASIMTLSKALARRIGVKYDPGNEMTLRLANGQECKGHPVILGKVEVGDAVAEDVAAVILPTAPAPGVDGLLGMSFLGRFEFSFDAGAERFELKKLRPR